MTKVLVLSVYANITLYCDFNIICNVCANYTYVKISCYITDIKKFTYKILCIADSKK
jgi:hypothetical protein